MINANNMGSVLLVMSTNASTLMYVVTICRGNMRKTLYYRTFRYSRVDK